jgi:serine/threonine-protein kinase ULK/ATG1
MKGIKQIKKYRLIKEIGKGATGIVYEAVDDETNKLYAIKSIPSQKLLDKRVMENFKRELKLLHGLNHGNIIKIVGVEKTVNNIYLILEYCNGGNLYEYTYYYRKEFNSPLPEKKVQQILIQLIEGLEYMHNCKTVHRDIKLENILINFNSWSNTVPHGEIPQKLDYHTIDQGDITIKIADLGYARELEGAGVASTICGTPITMAPDIINLFDNNKNKDHKYNNKVDLWSLGAITYELITGRPPFYANNFKQLFEEILAGKYSVPKNIKISIEAITFINGLLQFYPEKRMDWVEIHSHPFITNDPNTFHIIDLHSVDTNYQDPNQLEIDTKDCQNFLWILFKNKMENIKVPLDKIDASIYQNPIIDTIKVSNNTNTNDCEANEKIEVNTNKPIIKEENDLNDDSEEKYEDANDELNLCCEDDNSNKNMK